MLDNILGTVESVCCHIWAGNHSYVLYFHYAIYFYEFHECNVQVKLDYFTATSLGEVHQHFLSYSIRNK